MPVVETRNQSRRSHCAARASFLSLRASPLQHQAEDDQFPHELLVRTHWMGVLWQRLITHRRRVFQVFRPKSSSRFLRLFLRFGNGTLATAVTSFSFPTTFFANCIACRDSRIPVVIAVPCFTSSYQGHDLMLESVNLSPGRKCTKTDTSNCRRSRTPGENF